MNGPSEQIIEIHKLWGRVKQCLGWRCEVIMFPGALLKLQAFSSQDKYLSYISFNGD